MSKVRVDIIADRDDLTEVKVTEIKQCGTFAQGLTINRAIHEIQDSNGNFWKWVGVLPKVVNAGTSPLSDSNYVPLYSKSGTTANRPSTFRFTGMSYLDTTLNKPIWWNGSAWIDATGTTV